MISYNHNYRKETSEKMDEYIALADQAEKKRLRVQKKNALLYIRRTERILKKHENSFIEQLKKIRFTIIPYVERKSHLPPSFRKMLNRWERRANR